MKSKTVLVLMEQLVMLLVFALAAAACLGIFTEADRISRETESQDMAVILAQNAAETLKACGGDLKALGGSGNDGSVAVLYDENGEPGGTVYRLEARILPAPASGLGKAEILVAPADTPGSPLFRLTCAWQEAAQ